MTIEDIYNLYEFEKRKKREVPKYYFNANTGNFETFNEIVKKHKLTEEKYYYEYEKELYKKIVELGYIPFINSYEICLKCMKKYLSEANDKNAVETFEKLAVDKNEIGRKLHFLDIYCNGLYGDFELAEVTKMIKKWCSRYNIVL